MRGPIGQGIARAGSIKGLQHFVLIFICLVLLILNKLDYGPLRTMRDAFTDFAAPGLEIVSLPALQIRRGWRMASNYIDLNDKLERLQAENVRLRQWEGQVEHLEQRLAKMRALLNAVEDPGLVFKSSRVIADSSGPFARAVLVNMGADQHVKAGYAVMGAGGLAGRIVHVGARASRVLLLDDLDSRIPVLVGPTAMRAVLVGSIAALPRLEFATSSAGLYDGDEVYTSGDDGLLPRGLRIGKLVATDGDDFNVRPYADLDELEFVSVLFFNVPSVPSGGAQEPLVPQDSASPDPIEHGVALRDRSRLH